MATNMKKAVQVLFFMTLAIGLATPAIVLPAGQNDKLRKSQWTSEPTFLGAAAGSADTKSAETVQSSSLQPPLSNLLPEKSEYASDRVIVKYRSEPVSVSVDSLSAQVVGASELSIPQTQLLKLAPGTDVNAVIQELLKDSNVLYAEPDYKVYSAIQPQSFRPVEQAADAAEVSAAAADSPIIPNDPLFNEQWGLHNTGQPLNEGTVPGGPPDIDMELPEAWTITTGSEDTVVALIGNGVKVDTPDLQGQIWVNGNDVLNGSDDDGNGLVDDINGWDFANHDNTLFDESDGLMDVYGTAVAGLITAQMNNNEGIAGIAPGVKVMPLKVVSSNGGYYTDVVEAIQYAEEHGVKVASMGIVYAYRSKLVEDAINASNMLFVAPAGDIGGNNILNTDVRPIYPAAYPSPNVLSVTGVNILGEPALGAAIGQVSVDVAAPSELIITSVPDVNAGYAAQMDSGTYKAYYHGIGFEEIPNDYPGFEGQRQDMFDLALDYLLPPAGIEPNVLLVNDSQRSFNDGGGGIGPVNWEEDPLSVYEELLGQAGYTFDVYTTQDETFNGPSLAELQPYNVVVWFTGTAAAINGAKLITDRDQASLTDYLNGGGHLMLTGQDAIDQIPDSDFVSDVLGLKLVKEGGYIFKGWGVDGTIYEDREYKLMDFSLFYDTVMSAKPDMTTVNIKNTKGDYSYAAGTLYAAAYAAGTAALVQSQDPDMSALAIKQRVVNSGKSFPSLRTITASGKMINAHRALWNKDIPGRSLLDSTVSGRLDEADDPNHVYSVELGAGEEVAFHLTGEPGTDFDLVLYDSSAATVLSRDGAVAFSETQGTSTESITYRATAAGTYYINLFAFAGAGRYTLDVRYSNTSGALEEDDPSLAYEGNWTRKQGAAYSNGAIRQLTGEGNVQFSFRGNHFEWIGTRDDKQGVAAIWIDGFPMGYADLYSDTTQNQQSLFKMVLPNGHHDVKITSARGANGKFSINVDRFVFSSLISPTHASAKYAGPWAYRYGVKYPDGVQTYSTTPGNSVEFAFTGTKVTLWSTTGNNRGKVNILIDGQSVTPEPIDLYSDALTYQVPVFTSDELTNTAHKIAIVHANERNPQSNNNIVTIDGLDVLNLN